jgi:hypothetical protein
VQLAAVKVVALLLVAVIVELVAVLLTAVFPHSLLVALVTLAVTLTVADCFVAPVMACLTLSLRSLVKSALLV